MTSWPKSLRHTRFAAFAAMPMRDPAAAAAELDRAVRTLGFRGAMINGLIDGRFLDDPQFAPVLADHLATAGWGWHAETALHALRMVSTGVFDRIPDLRLIVGHTREMIPFALARVDTVLTPVAGLRRSVADYFQTNIWFTTSGYTTFPPLQCALSVVGIDRLIFSVDYPYTDSASARAA